MVTVSFSIDPAEPSRSAEECHDTGAACEMAMIDIIDHFLAMNSKGTRVARDRCDRCRRKAAVLTERPMGRAFAAGPANKQQWTTFAEDGACRSSGGARGQGLRHHPLVTATP